MRKRACAAILRGDTILMVHHVHDGRAYWTLPGGGIEPGETPAEAAVREVREETGLHASVVRFLFRDEGESLTCDCFLLGADAAQQSTLGSDPEEAHLPTEARMLQGVAWRLLSELGGDAQIHSVLRALEASSPTPGNGVPFERTDAP